jgi:hypothetical protein
MVHNFEYHTSLLSFFLFVNLKILHLPYDLGLPRTPFEKQKSGKKHLLIFPSTQSFICKFIAWISFSTSFPIKHREGSLIGSKMVKQSVFSILACPRRRYPELQDLLHCGKATRYLQNRHSLSNAP